jgi:hypothetical protein
MAWIQRLSRSKGSKRCRRLISPLRKACASRAAQGSRGVLPSLRDAERAFLVSARRGEGLLAAGSDRVAFQTVASSIEHRLVTSDPAEPATEEPDL